MQVNKPICPKCNGEESYNSKDLLDNGNWKCHECQTEFAPEEREMVRVNTRISAELNDWLDDKSKKSGVPKSAIIHMALEQYVTQTRSVEALQLSQGTLRDLFAKVEQIEKKLSSGAVMES